MAFGTTWANAELDAIYGGQRGQVRLALFDQDPDLSNGTVGEIAGIARINPVGRMGAASNKQIVNTQALDWTGVPASTARYIAAYIDDVYYKGGDINPDVVIQQGNTFRIQPGGYVDIWE